MVIEGISTTRAAYELAQEPKVYANYTGHLPSYHHGTNIKDAIYDIIDNEFKAENEWCLASKKGSYDIKKLEKQSSLPLDSGLDFYQQPKHLLKRNSGIGQTNYPIYRRRSSSNQVLEASLDLSLVNQNVLLKTTLTQTLSGVQPQKKNESMTY